MDADICQMRLTNGRVCGGPYWSIVVAIQGEPSVNAVSERGCYRHDRDGYREALVRIDDTQLYNRLDRRRFLQLGDN